MVPFRLTQPQFAERYRRSLDRASPTAIATLRAHFALPIQDGVLGAEVKIFVSDEEEPDPPAVWIDYLGKDNKVDAADPTLHAGRSLELALGFQACEQFDRRFTTDEKFGGIHLMANALKAWFAECWWKAGGWTYPVPVTLQVHDGFGDGKPVTLTEKPG
ncbi:MAG: hypothetical protein AB1899_05435 [Pseudomonadota bacterium]